MQATESRFNASFEARGFNVPPLANGVGEGWFPR